MSKKTKPEFTPGPWGVEAEIMTLKGRCVNTVNGSIIVQTDILHREHDARLIAAAPELYKTLEMLVGAFNVKRPDPVVIFAAIEKARAVLAKVERE